MTQGAGSFSQAGTGEINNSNKDYDAFKTTWVVADLGRVKVAPVLGTP